MNKKEQISLWQLMFLFIITITGSAIVNIPQPILAVAHNGAWISLIMSSGFGWLGLACIYYLHRQYPEMTLVEYAKQILGRPIGTIILIPFLCMPLILLPNMVADIGNFFTSTMMKETPVYAFNIVIVFTAAMTVQAGIEVMARMFTFLLIVMCISVVIVLFLVLPLYHPEYLLPVLPKGWKPVLHGVYISSSFPFADVIFLSMLLPFMRQENRSRFGSTAAIAYLLAIGSLIVVTLCSTMVLGNVAGHIKFSLYQLARMISVGDVVERVEMLVGITLIVGSYMKTSIILFSLTLGIAQLTGLRDYRILTYPVAWTAFFLSLTMYANQSEFTENVSVTRPLMSITVSTVPLLFLALVSCVKNRFTKRSGLET
ncbi:endospore germination permease [Paenibacillus sp. GCM10023248]|uniref:GerAB/ArcD/ProY family transporter n=1 Tax=Bacillales TaxID=1385 RepID=UPI0023792849|nr:MULTISPECIES: endospore germination permease [Bacillales]MDD9269066.1 endospore germination permease [Paenibacillus sp. MAHUQ-63]MDR6880713.1 spore germination protein KB [Bacillus sp. 3255]